VNLIDVCCITSVMVSICQCYKELQSGYKGSTFPVYFWNWSQALVLLSHWLTFIITQPVSSFTEICFYKDVIVHRSFHMSFILCVGLVFYHFEFLLSWKVAQRGLLKRTKKKNLCIWMILFVQQYVCVVEFCVGMVMTCSAFRCRNKFVKGSSIRFFK